MSDYLVGQTKRVICTFTDASGAPSDPTTIILKVGRDQQNGNVSALATYSYASATVSRSGTGIYYADYTFATAGSIVFEWQTSGNPTTKAVLAVPVLLPYNWT